MGGIMLQQFEDLTDKRAAIALDEGEFHLLFQPKIALGQPRMTGAEAYVRWAHPELGRLLPASFLSALDRQNLLPELTVFVLREAARAARRWYNQGRSWQVTFNISPGELSDRELGARLSSLIDEVELPAKAFGLDIPEAAFLAPDANLVPVLEDLKHRGLSLALEGHGALSLTDDQVPLSLFDELKISGSAVIKFALTTGGGASGMVHERLALADKHGLPVTAVGVEDARTLQSLQALGFAYAQGAFIARPAEDHVLDTWHLPKPVLAALTGDSGTAPQAQAPAPRSKTIRMRPLQDSLAHAADMPEAACLFYEDIAGFESALPDAANLDPLCLLIPERRRLLSAAPQIYGRRVPGIEKRIVMKVRESRAPQRTGFLARLGL